MVELDSAQLYFPREQLMSAEADHKQIAKVKKGEGGIYSRIKSAVRQGLVSTARIVASVEAHPDPHTQVQLLALRVILGNELVCANELVTVEPIQC
jgi:hypothetical protein